MVTVIIVFIVVLISVSHSFDSKASIPGGDTLKSVPNTNVQAFVKFRNAEENENCLKCHGQSKYSYDNKESGKLVFKRMYSELILNRSVFYESNHKEFKCIDCHSEDYKIFPHAGNLRMASKPNCLDCHGGDEKYAKFHFENIEKEFQESVHSEKHSQDFTCWMCHNGHTYKINARPNENIKQTIMYDNAICLSCHGDITKYELLTDKENPNLIEKHEWLPNQQLHFKSVRCIECHTKKINDSTLVAHNIRPKAEAVKKCEECHSSNSVLLAALYKYKIREIRSAKGFFSGIITSNSYVIGANRNYYLNLLSLVILGFVLIGIAIHTVFRILK